MWFLIKGSFWFTIILLVLPFFGTEQAIIDEQTPPAVELSQAYEAATTILGDVGQVCVRNPDLCITGAKAFNALGQQAKQGAKIAYTFLNDKFSDGTDPVTTGSIQ